MANFYAVGDLVRSVQSIDMTGQYVIDCQDYGTSASLPFNLYVFDTFGDQIPVDTVKSKLDSIRRKSQAEFGEAWSKLAQM